MSGNPSRSATSLSLWLLPQIITTGVRQNQVFSALGAFTQSTFNLASTEGEPERYLGGITDRGNRHSDGAGYRRSCDRSDGKLAANTSDAIAAFPCRAPRSMDLGRGSGDADRSVVGGMLCASAARGRSGSAGCAAL